MEGPKLQEVVEEIRLCFSDEEYNHLINRNDIFVDSDETSVRLTINGRVFDITVKEI